MPRQPTLCSAAVFLALWCVCGSRPAQGQSFLDGLRQRVEREIQNSVPQFGSQPQRRPPGSQPPARTRGSIPGESGGENNRNRFGDNGFFLPPSSSPPRYSNPTYGNSPPGGSQTNRARYYSTPSGTNRSSSIRRLEPPATKEVFSNRPIVIRCPRSAAQPVSYQLLRGDTSYAFTMRPGEAQTFNETQLWLIRFSSGTAEKTYRLRGDNKYTFETDSQQQLQLYRESSSYSEPPLRQGN